MGAYYISRKVLVLSLLSSGAAYGVEKDFPMSVNSANSGDSVISAPAAGMVVRSGKETTTIKINNTCFGTNLRGVGNPLAPNSIIEAKMIFVLNGEDHTLTVRYPADLVTKSGMKTSGNVQPLAAGNFSMSGGGNAAIFGNSVIINTPVTTGVTVDESGKITIPPNVPVRLKSATFEQKVQSCSGGAVYGSYGYSSYTPTYACGDYMGKNGALSASLGGMSVSADKSNIELNVSFPGQTGFCGSYWSPLMVFFDDARPKFTNVSDFPLNPIGKTMWPEANSPGWFVAVDKDQNDLIDQRIELFGDGEGHKNGFEALRAFDSNKDGVIDHRDKDFKKLVLWQDKNGDGISQADEIIPLHSKVTKISLNYEKDVVRPLGKYAEARERSKFWYKENGKIKKGDIIDIWLAPAETKLSQR